jgi:hypothetical protein
MELEGGMRGELHGALLTGEWLAGGEGIHGFFLVCFTLITNIPVLRIRTRTRIRREPHSFFGWLVPYPNPHGEYESGSRSAK